MRALLVAALALAGCGDLFDAKAPQGYACGAGNSCPPGQQCVPGEKVCRTPCTQTTMSGGTIGNNGQCTNLNESNTSTSGGYSCDYDHFCRPSCFNPGGTCAGCSGTNICDTTVNVCRPACGDGCPSTWGCVDGSIDTGMNATMCAVCRPLATSTLHAPQFADVVFYDGATGEHTSAIATGDLQGSGHASVVAVDISGQKLYVYANDGSGALQPSIAYGVTPQPFDAVVVDIDRDGKNDVVVATAQAPAGGPVFLRGNGDGTLGAQVGGPMIPSTKLTVGDFDGDGKLDVAMCGAGTNTLSAVTANGSGGLKMLGMFGGNPGASFVRIGAADVDDNGKLDVWADDEHGFVNTFLGNGMGGFTQGTNSSFSTRYDEATVDVDGDKKPDLAVVTGMPASGGMAYSLVLGHNNGGGGFNTTGAAISIPASGQLATGDFDGDGKVDVAMVEMQSGKATSNVDIFTSDGTKLVFVKTIPVSKGAPTDIAVADVDADGKPDIVLGLGDGGVAVLLNTTQ